MPKKGTVPAHLKKHLFTKKSAAKPIAKKTRPAKQRPMKGGRGSY